MDAERFDDLLRSLFPGTSRRSVLASLAGVFLAGVPLVYSGDVAARKRRRKHRRKKNRKTPKPAPTCSDGFRNGNETGVDCGGDCPRCADGQSCATRDDCASARCGDGTCQGCTSNLSCGTDGEGLCLCGKIDEVAQEVCLHAMPMDPWVTDCADCPPDTVCYASAPGAFDCLRLCGSVE